MSDINRINQLIEIIEKYNKAYYVLDSPIVSDKEYDKLYYELVELEKSSGIVLPYSPTLKVGGEPLDKFKKVSHKKKLLSLDKAQTIGEIENWNTRNSKIIGNKKVEFTLEYKFDGLAMVLTYQNGIFVRATTRGNGNIGEDVTRQIMTIHSVPLSIPFQGYIEVQGEAIMKLSALAKYNKLNQEPLKNARNAAAGAVRNLDPKVTASRKLDFFAYNINYIENKLFNTQSEQYNFLKDNGFLVSDYFRLSDSFEEIEKYINDVDLNKKTLDFLIDGMVIKYNDIHLREELGFTDKFPRGMIAFKFDPEEITTTLSDIVWQVGRTGKLTPIAILEPVNLAGATVKRATLNNFNDIQKKKVKINSRVFVRRSNEVIPEIMGLAEEFENSIEIQKPTHCPACGTELKETIANLFCPNYFGCKPQIVGRLVHFCTRDAFNIEGLSEKTIELLVEKNIIREFSDIFKLKSEQLNNLEGFKIKKISNLLSSIDNSKKIELPAFIYALGIENVGKKTARDLSNRFLTIDNLINAQFEQLIEMKDIAEITATNIVEYFQNSNNVTEIQLLINSGIDILQKNQSTVGKLSNYKIVLTGKLQNYTRDQAAKLLEELGAEIQSTVTKSTTLLIAGEDSGSKLAKAKALGVKIVDEKEFDKIIAN